MRTIIDLPQEQLQPLDEFCRLEGISRAEGVRRAVARMLETENKPSQWKGLDAFFGMWKDREDIGDSVEYQRKLRAEWNREWDKDQVIPVFDSNIVIDLGKGYPQAFAELHRYTRVAISITSWMEVMSGNMGPEEENTTKAFLTNFELVHIDMPLANQASRLRREHRLKLPDAIIWATARSRNTLLVTRDIKDFPQDDPAIRVPYTL